MQESSVGIEGRTGEFTLDYYDGIINTHEEVFETGRALGLIDLTGRTYSFHDKKYDGKKNIIEAIRDDQELFQSILKECISFDYQRSGKVNG